ncbi:hypothetical protein [Streptomyces rhizosphaerihabitans]|uniref:hypothetical protein n=1 Tax=Streptomyces rhizosphaerihabitans TaxID=1266770 RepID=UPI0021BF1309|nr:hypothetical protein [Streptomyces rhizosphaerihabitans]MCT9008146.1 hypothetical protein [Streptomyces rhizosphaerihabitans]
MNKQARRRSLVLGCASVAAGLLLGPVPAAHAATAPELVYAGDIGGGSSGLVEVSAQSDSAITSITAHLYAEDEAAGAAEITRVTDFTRTSGTDQQGVWQTGTPLRLADLGHYRLVIDLTDADGDTSTTQARYGFSYCLTTSASDFQVTPSRPDFTHRKVSVSGRYMITDPRTRDTTPADGQVDIHTSNGGTTTVHTDAEGRFATTYTQTATSGDVSSWLRLPTPEPMEQGSQTVWVSPVRSDTRVTLDSTGLSLKEGEPAKISGLAELFVDGAWRPLAGTTVVEDWWSDMGGATSRPVTGADGRFTGELKMSQTGKVHVSVSDGTYLNASPDRTVQVTVARKASVSGFTVSLNKYAELTAAGYLHTGTSIPLDAYNHVQLQYSADGKTGWKTMKTVTPGHGEPETGNHFKGTFDAPAKGYYRAYFAGSPSWQPAYSKVLHAERTQTRITGGNASPEPVTKGRTLTVAGTLQHYTSSAWRAYSGQKVKILFRPRGSSTWYDEGDTTTRSNGSFSKAFTARQDGTWVAVLLYPNSTHLVSSGREDYVDVR